MSKYPKIITAEILEQNSAIDSAQIKRDIFDTETEIREKQRKYEAYKILADGTGPEAKMASFRSEASLLGVKERMDFVAFLTAILAARKEKQNEL